MLTSTQEEKSWRWINWAFYFLMLGFLSSPTLVSLYHIVLVIPACIIFIKGVRSNISTSSWILLALFGWGLISTLVNVSDLINPNKAFQELKFYLFGVLFIPAFTLYFKKVKKHQLKKLINMVSFVIIAAFFVGISKSYLGFDPVKMRFGEFHIRSGGFTNYMRYGYASAFLAILFSGLFFNRKKIQGLLGPRWFYPALFLCFAAIGTSQTRGGLLGLLVGGSFLLLKYKPKIGKVMIGAGALFAAVIIYCSFINPEITKIRFLNINQASNNTRMSQFLSAGKSMQEKPWFGLGADQFSYHVIEIKKRYGIWSQHYAGHAHNIVLEHGANYGIPGAILLILFLITWFAEMVKKRNDFGWIFASYILAFSIAGQVENLFDNTNSHLLFFIYTLSQVKMDKLDFA
jgi:O-antigen ligase